MIPQVILDLCNRVTAMSNNPKNAQNRATFDAACRYIYLMQHWALVEVRKTHSTMQLNAYLTLYICCISSRINLAARMHVQMTLARFFDSFTRFQQQCHPVT